MNWHELISNKRLGQEYRHAHRRDERTEFKRDYDRLIFSAAFRRLQNKTQVFPLPGSIFVHNRLTHSLEVASVGSSLGTDVARELVKRHPDLSGTLFEEINTIVSTACLAHDMGNPPFGHSGEKAIQSYFLEGPGQSLKGKLSKELWSDLTHFEGNANAFRLLTHRFKGRRGGGFAMTYSTLASIVKYPHSSMAAGEKGKFGFFYTERSTYEKIAKELGISSFEITVPNPDETAGNCITERKYHRHPLVYLVEAADDICYEIMDIEDAHKLKLLSFKETEDLLLGFFNAEESEEIRNRIIDEGVEDENEKIVYMRACVIGKLEQECAMAFVQEEENILNGRFEGSLIKHTPPQIYAAYKRCTEVSVKKIYRSKAVLDVELSGYRIIETLLDKLMDAAINPTNFHSQQLIHRFSSQYDIHSDDLETRIMAVIDYISGMTDVFALDIYQKINGISLPII